jgi:hypothetical protein
MVLSNLKKKPAAHPTKKTFQKFKIPFSNIAREVGCSYNHFLALINGHLNMSTQIDEKLHELARQLEAEAKGGGS